MRLLVFRSRRFRAISAMSGSPESPVLAFWGEMSAILSSPAPAAGRLNPYAIAFFQAHARLTGKRFPAAIVMPDLRSASRAISPALQSVWPAAATIGQQRNF
jgi:hypothetical protein